MEVLVISLDRTPERYQWFLEANSDLAPHIFKVNAVDGKKLPRSDYDRLSRLKSGHFGLGPNEVACYLSHRAAWERIVASGSNWAFVAEDDIHMGAGAEKFVGNDDWIPEDADIVKAETVLEPVEVSWLNTSRHGGRAIHRLQSKHAGAAGYFLSRKAAERLLEEVSLICDPVDQILFNPLLGVADKLSIYQISPAICIQDFLLLGTEDHVGLESTLIDERASNAIVKKGPKPQGPGKLMREVRRLVDQASNFCRVYLINRSYITSIRFN